MEFLYGKGRNDYCDYTLDGIDLMIKGVNEKGLVNDDQPIENLVELRGIEPLTPRLPALCSPS